MSGYDEAVAWFRADPERVRDLDDVDNRSAAIAIVNAVLADDALAADPSPRSWSLPAPPPDDVTVVYIAGPMTGLPNYNLPAFAEAAESLTRAGFDARNPGHRGVVEGHTWQDYIRDGLRMLLDCDAVALLPGWDASRGASLEVTVARSLGMPVHPIVELLEGEPPAPEPQAAEPQGFDVGARVWSGLSGAHGVVVPDDESLSRVDGRVWVLFDGYDAPTQVRLNTLHPVSPVPPRFERGFYRLARDLDTEHGVIRERLVFAAYLDTVDEVWRVFCESGDAWVSAAALAAAGAERQVWRGDR